MIGAALVAVFVLTIGLTGLVMAGVKIAGRLKGRRLSYNEQRNVAWAVVGVFVLGMIAFLLFFTLLIV